MLEQRIQQHFIDSADLKYKTAQTLSTPIALAVQAVMACVTGGGKVIGCGNGTAGLAAQHFALGFLGKFERDRPELAALALSSDGAALTAIATNYDFRQIYARQLRALGNAGDLLLAISVTGNCPNVLMAVEAAHERELTVVALTGGHGGRLAELLRETDVHIGVAHERTSRVQEVHMLVLNCISESIDTQLLGEQEITA